MHAKPDDGCEAKVLQAWVEATAPRALAYARSLLRDRHAAEDLVQDCFCRLLARRTQYDLPNDGLKLLLRSVTNACIDLRRKQGREQSLDEVEGNGRAAEQALRVAEPAGSEPEPVAQAMGRELEQAIGQALLKLPVAQRAALELKSLGFSLAEIARSLKVSESNAGVLIHRARNTVARQLQAFLQADETR